MTNIKKELELMKASKNCDLEEVKSLVEANKYGINTLEKAKSIAQEVSCPEVVDYLENITRKKRGKELIENCRNALNRGNPESKMYFGKSNFRIDSNPPDDTNNDNEDNDNDINKQI